MKELSISALNQSLKNKDFTSVELTEYFLKRIKKYNKDLNAVITSFDEKAAEMFTFIPSPPTAITT